MSKAWDVVVIGAGISGCRVARTCEDAGLSVCMLEKSRGVGGRMSTRYTEFGRYDHGAQFFTARSAEFTDFLKSVPIDVVQTWWNSSSDSDEPGFVYRGTTGMNQLPRYLSEGLNVKFNTRVSEIQTSDNLWLIRSEEKEEWHARSVVVTAPLPQSLALVDPESTNPQFSDLRKIQYRKCVALLVRCEDTISFGERGIDRAPDLGLQTFTNNCQKGITDYQGSLLTIHCTPDFSDEIWELSKDLTIERILDRFRKVCSLDVAEVAVHRWRYCEPSSTVNCFFRKFQNDTLHGFLCGEVFNGPKVEAAYLSGIHTAQEILKMNAI